MANNKPSYPADALTAAQDQMLTGAALPSPADNLVPGPAAKQQSDVRLTREDTAGFTDYAGAAYRQDSFLDGLMAHLAGRELMPEEGYSVFDEAEWKDVSQGVWPEFQQSLFDAHSGAHARYLQSRILQKQDDLLKLGDLGWKGNTGRFLLGAIAPENMLTGMVGGWAFRGVKAVQTARALRAASGEGVLGAARARAAQASAGVPSVAVGVGVGAAENVALEKIRQSVNFEADDGQLVMAGLLGAAITAPFVWAGAKAQARLARAADQEAQALEAALAARVGAATPEQRAAADAVVKLHETILKVERGEISPEAAAETIDGQLMLFEGSDVDLTGVRNPFDTAGRVSQFLDAGDTDPQSVQGALFGSASAERLPGLRADASTPPLIRKSNPELKAREDDWRTIQARVNALDSLPTRGKLQEQLEAAKVALEQKRGAAALAEEKDRAFALAEHEAEIRKAMEIEAMLNERELRDAGFLPGSIGSAQVGKVANVPDQGTSALGKLRLDWYSRLNKSTNPIVRELGHLFVKDPIATDKFYAQGWTASEWKSHFRRTYGGAFHGAAKEAFLEAAKTRGLNLVGRFRWEREFYTKVTRATRGVIDPADQDIAAQLQKAATAQRNAYKALLLEAKAAGVRGADGIKPDDVYVNRIWSHEAMRAAELKHGRDNVIAALAHAIKVPGLTGDIEKATKFYNAVKRLEYSPMLTDLPLRSMDAAVLRRELADAGLGPSDIDAIVDTMFESMTTSKTADAGQAPNLKFRFDVDENYTHVMPNGERFTLADLFENDSRLLVDLYVSSMGGHTAFAKQGFPDKAAVLARLREAEQHAADNGMDANAFKREAQLLMDAYNHTIGHPMSTQDFSATNRIAGALRSYTRSATLGQLGLAAAFELKQAVALSSFSAMFTHMPSFRQFISAARMGRVPSKQLARDIEVMVGFGYERAMGYARQSELAEGFYDKALTRFEQFGNKASHAVDILSGNAGFTSLTRQWAGMGFIQRHFDVARKGSLTAKQRERLVAQGVDDDIIEDVLGALKRHTESPDGRRVEHIRWDDWLRDDPRTYDAYRLLLSREVRDAIQDHDIGETMPWMHTTLGKVFSELRTFTLVAHAKQFLKNAHFRDATAFRVWSIGFLGECLAYTTQNAINFAHNPAELERRLQPDMIARAAFFRLSSLGYTSFLFDTGYGLATGESLVQPGMTANTDNRSVFKTPSLALLQRAGNMFVTGAGMLNPNQVTTQKELREFFSPLPGANTWGARNLVDWLAGMQPKSQPKPTQ